MGRRLVVVMLIAGLIASGVFFFARMMQQSAPPAQVATQPVQAPVAANTTNVLVAAKDLPAGTLIQPNTLVFRPWPAAGVDEASHVVEGKGTIEEFTSAVLRTGVRSGEPVVRGNMIKRGEQGFLAAVLKPGMRAVSVNVNENTGVSGFVFPGDRVDIILSHVVNMPDANGTNRPHNVSETIMQDVRVIAVDQRASDQEQAPAVARGVTVEVPPEKAERIALLQRMGELRLVLRPLAREGEGEVSSDPAGQPVAMPVVDDAQDKRTFSLDSDVSQIITPPGGDKSGATGSGSIQVVRGPTAQDVQVK